MLKIRVISSFTGAWRFLSNFYPSPIVWEGERYPTIEHAYQASKTLNLVDRKHIRECNSPGRAKRMGRTVEMRDQWDSIKAGVMLKMLRLKFKPGSKLAQELLKTRDAKLVEENYWHDNYWGVCDCSECEGKGKNMLGLLLMKIRKELRQ